MNYYVFIFILSFSSLQAMQLADDHKQEITDNIKRCIRKRYVSCLGYLGKYSDWARGNEALATDLDNLGSIVENEYKSIDVRQEKLDDFTEKWHLEYIEFEDVIRR